MINDELRKHFDLKPCPNPPHEFRLGSWIGEWRWAEDCWSQLVGQQLQTLYFSIHSTQAVSGTLIWSLIFLKLKIIMGSSK